MSTRDHQSGFTLVEILVALVIGLFLTAGMLQMYVANKQSFRFSESLSRIQENGRYALAFIARDMRMVDFWGCKQGNSLYNNLASWCGASATQGIFGVDGAAGSPDVPDTITLRGAVGTALTLANSTGPLATTINVSGTVGATQKVLGDPGDKTGDIALISNCRGGDLFQVTAIDGGSPAVLALATGTNTNAPPGPPGNAIGNLSRVYDATATVHAWREVIYNVEARTDGENVLKIQENACAGGAKREVIEGVENMQFAYGMDADGNGTADRYVQATNVANWDNVVSVRVSLLLSSPLTGGSLTDQPQQIIYDDYDGDTSDDTFTAGDNRLYQVVTATFAVRNRTP